MMEPNITFSIQYNPMNGTFDLFGTVRDGERRGVLKYPEYSLKEHEPGTYLDPTLRLQPEQAQRLMDELWRAGLRPNDGDGGPAQVNALRLHLNDMRAIVAAKLNVDLNDRR